MTELRSIFTKAPFLGLSATVNIKVLEDIKAALQIRDQQFHLVARLPDRPNIYLEIRRRPKYDLEEELEWIVRGLRDEGQNYPKTIIFSTSIMTVYEIYAYIKNALGGAAYVQEEKSHATRLISMFHGEIGEELQSFTLKVFQEEKSVLRVLVSTVAFGMGVEVLDIRQIIHWGRGKTMLSHWQEVGRAGRDGQKASAIWYPKAVGGNDDKDVFNEIMQKKNICIRKMILQHFSLPDVKYDEEDSPILGECRSCDCCSHCQLQCGCKQACDQSIKKTSC